MRFQCMKFESAHRLFNLERVRLSILDFGFWIEESFELGVAFANSELCLDRVRLSILD